MWSGTKESFKNLLDKYLENIPDQPEVNNMIPGGRTMLGYASNSIPDWIRILELDDYFPDSLTIPADSGKDISSTNSNISMSIGVRAQP